MDDPDGPNVPAIFKALPPIRDSLLTETSVIQDETVKECLPLLAGAGTRSLFDYNEHGVPSLEREKHIDYLHERLGQLPAGFVAFDAARPWLIYWTLTGLCLLGENVDRYRARYEYGVIGPAESVWSKSVETNLIELLQCCTNIHPHAELNRRLWWRSWPNLPLRPVICCRVEPGHGRR